ncbi:MAG: RNA polymerase factor sigma-54 [Gammaproteobacteria bacterium]|jgi:RNA polymerase sigma-54 factor
MKHSLQLRVSQNLAMTPQLQQAIRLLQLSSLELKTEIQEALDSNIMLEADEAEEDNATEPLQKPETKDETEELELKERVADAEIPDDLPVDTAWDDIYDGNVNTSTSQGIENEYIEQQNTEERSLADHLMWQINLTPLSETDRSLAITIIDFINRDGYLTCPLVEILPIFEDEPGTDIEELEAVLHLIQSMEPAGIGARDLKECLILQLLQLPDSTPWLVEAKNIINKHLDLLASHDYNQLIKKTSLNREQLSEAITLIQSLNPRPGSIIHDFPVQYIAPDIYVKKDSERWTVELNSESAPRLRINSGYADMIKRADNSPDNNSLKEHLQEARWLIKSLQSRSETLLRVSTSIVERQKAFLNQGEQAMKPMVLNDIAEELDMHESTISRVTTNKYMHTPRGIYELKYFFSSHVSTDSGGVASSTAIRAHIKKLITNENNQKPLSDSKIALVLGKQGIKVARRTIAKYREALSIPPSNERKKLV